MMPRSLLSFTGLVLMAANCATGSAPQENSESQTHLTIQGERFLLSGKAFDMWGVRVASGSQSDQATDALLTAMADYRAHGINAVTVYYQGSSGGRSDPFNADGTDLDPDHKRRMEAIIRRAAELHMVVVVGLFYQNVRAEDRHLQDAMAYRNAARLVARTLQHHRNIIFNPANEQNSGNWKDEPFDMRDPQQLGLLCRDMRKEAPGILIGAGGYDHDRNEAIGRDACMDVLLFDTNGPEDSGGLHDRFRKVGVQGKPIVNVETFGGWTGKFQPQGVFPQEVRDAYFAEIAAARSRPGLSVFFHNNLWFQGPSIGAPLRFDIGGDGTTQSPGMGWLFQHLRAAGK